MGYLKGLYYRLVLKLHRWSKRQLQNRFKEIEPSILNKVEQLILVEADKNAKEIVRREVGLKAILQKANGQYEGKP